MATVLVRIKLTRDEIAALKRYADDTSSNLTWREEVVAAAEAGVQQAVELGMPRFKQFAYYDRLDER